MKPGEYFLEKIDIAANSTGEPISIEVANTGDRPVQVGSHFHFYEVNRALLFEREQAYGRRLNIPSGTAMRFEPGQVHVVDLIDFGGTRTVYGFNRLVEGKLDQQRDHAESKLRDFLDNG